MRSLETDVKSGLQNEQKELFSYRGESIFILSSGFI
jgi:hypothetical protein